MDGDRDAAQVVDGLTADNGERDLGLDARVQAAGTTALLSDVAEFIRLYVVLTPSQIATIALWVLHTWVIDAFDVTPYLAITSPEKQAGKTRLLEVVELLLRSPLRVANISEAALFRSIDDTTHGRISILLDEADAIFTAKGQHEDMRALLNAGYRRGAVVARCEGESRRIRVVRYDAFGAKAIAAIGNLPDTITDRSIPILMQRRAHHEVISRFRAREVRAEAAKITDALGGWATPEMIEIVRAVRPEVPCELGDRAADGWEPLLAIAELACGEWPDRARRAAVELNGAQGGGESTRELLLRHIKDVFDQTEADFIPTGEMLKALIARDDGPWPTWWANDVEAGRTKGPAAKLAAQLRPFGIAPGQQRVGDAPFRGYYRASFMPAWQRWLFSSPPASKSQRSLQANLDAGFRDFESRDTGESVTTSKTHKTQR